MKKENRIVKIISIIVALVFLVSAVICIGMILSMNVVPTKYLQILLGILIPVTILVFSLLILRKTPKAIKIFLILIALGLLAGFCTGINYIYNTFDFMDNIKVGDYQTENYYIVVKKDSTYKDIKELNGKNIGVFVEDNKAFSNALSDINSKIKFYEKQYPDYSTMTNNLINENNQAMIMSNAHYEFMKEASETFEAKTRIIYTISVKMLMEDIKKDVDVTKEPFNVYISGIDTFGNITAKSRSDVNIIMTIHPTTRKILLTTIPRDYYIKLHGTTGYKDKLTHAGVYGVDTSVKTIQDLLNIDINYYVRVNFNTLINVVDVIGGVDVYSDKSFIPYADSTVRIQKGINHLNGQSALAFSRERHAYTEGDRHRGQNQQAVITAIIDKITKSKTIVTKYNQILNSLEGSFQTNMNSSKIYSLIKMQLNDMRGWSIESISLDGTGKKDYTYSYGNRKLYVMEPDQTTVINAQSKIKALEAAKK